MKDDVQTAKEAKELAESDIAIMPEMELAGATAKAAIVAAIHARKAVQRVAKEAAETLRTDPDGERAAWAAAMELESADVDEALARLVRFADGIATYA